MLRAFGLPVRFDGLCVDAVCGVMAYDKKNVGSQVAHARALVSAGTRTAAAHGSRTRTHTHTQAHRHTHARTQRLLQVRMAIATSIGSCIGQVRSAQR